MAYSLVTFDSVNLPLCMPEDPLGSGAVQPGLAGAAGGVFDRYNGRTVLPRVRPIDFRGRYDGSSTALRTQLDALRAKVGVWGLLVRKRDDDSVLQSVYARLLSVDGTWVLEDGASATLNLRWETGEPSWRAATGSTASGSVGGSTSIVNDGTAPVVDAIITLTASGGALVNPTLTIAALGVALKWTGSIADTKALVIDCGAMTVKNDGANAYSGFSLEAAHTARGWMPLTVATHALAVAGTGAGSVGVAFVKRYF